MAWKPTNSAESIFLAIADRFQKSKDPTESKRLREELASYDFRRLMPMDLNGGEVE